MKIRTTLLLGALLVSGIASCSTSGSSFKVTFHQDEGNKNDVKQVDSKTTAADLKSFQDGITLNPRKGYNVSWEDYDADKVLKDKVDFTVNAKYSLAEYTITYKNGETILGTQKYTVNTKKTDLKEPALPSAEAGYEYAYEAYTLENKAQDFTVNAIKSEKIYYAKFVDETGLQVGELVPFTISTTSIEEPAVPEKTGYDGFWSPYLFEAHDMVINPYYTIHDYTITYKYGDVVKGTQTYNINTNPLDIVEPDLPEEAGCDFKWSDYTIVGKHEDITVQAVRTLHTYYATFKNENGEQVGEKVPFTKETTSITEPAVPSKTGYSGVWNEYTLGLEDITITPKYTANQYTITFKDGDTTVKEVKYTVESDEATIKAEEPAVPSKTGYTGAWPSWTIQGKAQDFTVNCQRDLIKYKATFVNKDGGTVATKEFTVQTTSIDEPDVPSRDYYTGKWEDYTLSAADITIHPVYTAIKYTATFKLSADDANPVVKEFTADSPSVTAPAVSEEHYSTVNWVNANNPSDHVNGGASFSPALGSNVTYLKYVADGEKHTITLNKNGGTLTDTSVQVEYGKAYTLPSPTFKSGVGDFIGWFDTTTGEQVPTTGTSAFTSDVSVIARYGAMFETEACKGSSVTTGAVQKGTANCTAAKDLVDDSGSQGSKALRITTQASKTFRATIDADLCAAAFADPNVVAINFDAKASAKCWKFSVGNNVTSAYEYADLNTASSGFGLDTVWKTFSLTREKYNAQTDKGILFCTVGDQLPEGGYFYIDNIRPVSEPLTIWGFENSRLVDYVETHGEWYNRNVSFRNFEGKEAFTIGQKETATDCYFGYDYSVKSEGMRSLKYHRTGDCWCNLNVVTAQYDWESVTFDICLSIAYNGNTLRKGNGGELFPTTKVIKANEWATFTVNRSDANGGCFAAFTGTPTFDFWIDNLKVVLKSA